MVWNAVNRQHEATIPLPIGNHEFKFVILCGYLHSQPQPRAARHV